MMKKERYKLPFAAHLFLIKDNKILLYLRKGGKFDNMYSLIAGHVEEGETATNTIIREAKEESNIDIDSSDVNFSCFSHSNAGNKEFTQIFFVCKNWSSEIKNMEENRCFKLIFCDINNLPSNTVSYIKKAINCYLNKIAYFEFDW